MSGAREVEEEHEAIGGQLRSAIRVGWSHLVGWDQASQSLGDVTTHSEPPAHQKAVSPSASASQTNVPDAPFRLRTPVSVGRRLGQGMAAAKPCGSPGHPTD